MATYVHRYVLPYNDAIKLKITIGDFERVLIASHQPSAVAGLSVTTDTKAGRVHISLSLSNWTTHCTAKAALHNYLRFTRGLWHQSTTWESDVEVSRWDRYHRCTIKLSLEGATPYPPLAQTLGDLGTKACQRSVQDGRAVQVFFNVPDDELSLQTTSAISLGSALGRVAKHLRALQLPGSKSTWQCRDRTTDSQVWTWVDPTASRETMPVAIPRPRGRQPRPSRPDSYTPAATPVRSSMGSRPVTGNGRDPIPAQIGGDQSGYLSPSQIVAMVMGGRRSHASSLDTRRSRESSRSRR